MTDSTKTTPRIPPLKFRPIFKRKIWGGNRILPLKGIADSDSPAIGESWEISGVSNNETPVSEGFYKGLTITELTATFKERLVGSKSYTAFGKQFPILVKFIDAASDLSIQVHPNDLMAQKYGYPNGKTEMWYVVAASREANIVSGFKKQVTPEEYKRAVSDNTILGLLQEHKARTGDCFFIPAGRIHSIGGGTLLIEIQQTNDLTYRIYDYNRLDDNGKTRPLHTELAAEALDFGVMDSYRTTYTPQTDKPTNLVDCKIFRTRLLSLTRDFVADYSHTDSFVIYVAFGGSATITDNWGNRTTLARGESVMIPAETNQIDISPGSEGVEFIETTL